MYLDLLFLVNLVVNALLLAAAARLTDTPFRPARLLTGAAAGAACAVVFWFLAGTPGLSLMRAACALLTVSLAFGPQALLPALRRAGALWAVSCILAGLFVCTSAHAALYSLPLGAAGVLLICGAVSALRREQKGLREAVLTREGRSVTLRVFPDTGHTLSDPITNRPVLIASYDALRPLFSPACAAVMDAVGVSDAPALLAALDRAGIRGFMLIPYRTVGLPAGLLAAFAPDRAVLDGQETAVLAALSPTPLSSAWDALAGAV